MRLAPVHTAFQRNADEFGAIAAFTYAVCAAARLARFNLDTGEKLIASKGLFEYDDILKDYHFIRCHQSHLVNRKYIKSLLSSDTVFELQLTVKDKRIPVSRLKKEGLL